MFTGMIESTAGVLAVTDSGLTIVRPPSFADLQLGSSISVSGVCVSVVALSKDAMRFDVIPETRERTTLGRLHVGDRVNLERSLKADGRFEGHVVQGHVEGVGVVMAVDDKGRYEAEIELPGLLVPFALGKGSIALDGVSLTIARIAGDRITVALIPHTLEHTTLGSWREGDGVNVETDILLRGLAHQQAVKKE